MTASSSIPSHQPRHGAASDSLQKQSSQLLLGLPWCGLLVRVQMGKMLHAGERTGTGRTYLKTLLTGLWNG